MSSLSVIAYSLAITAVVLFAVGACGYAWMRQKRQGGPDTPEFFLTARHSVGTFTIAWSFYAGAMGSWALFGPPSYALYAGIMGVIFYAVGTGLPIIVIAIFGSIIHRLVPNVLSMSDFVHRRFGLLVAVYVAILMLFNMGIALTAEYTAVGDLFQYVIGAPRVPILLVIGGVTMLYTAWGGLFVSIITDQWQALCSVVFLTVLVIYVCITFRAPLGPLPDYLSWSNYYGLASIASMPISLVAFWFFSEAMWQRCWASANRRTLLMGALLGSLLVTLAVFLLGFGGLLAAWGNVWVPAGPDDTGNTILFSLFNGETWVLVFVSLLSVLMSESAIDSFQNAIVDTISSMLYTLSRYMVVVYPKTTKGVAFVESMGLWWIRGLVLILNIPPIIVSFQGFGLNQLFLAANLVSSTSVLPIMAGVYSGPFSRQLITPFSVMAGCMSGLASLFWWTAIIQQPGESYNDALYNTFFVTYDYPPFLLALGLSLAGLALGAALEFGARISVPSWRQYPEFDLQGPGLTNTKPWLEEEEGKGGEDTRKEEMQNPASDQVLI